MRIVPALWIGLGLTLAYVAGAASQPLDTEAGEALFAAKCSTCHPLDRPLKKHKNRAGWERTVDRMKRYASGTISSNEAAAILEYLVRVRGPKN